MSYKGTSDTGIVAWFIQRISGFFLLVVLIAHFAIMHFTESEQFSKNSYQFVLQRFGNPAWKLFDMSFLILGLYHGLNGVKMIIDDYIVNQALRFVVLSVLYIFGLGLFVVGAITILTIGPRTMM